MLKEFEFFIEEDAPQLNEWKAQKEKNGVHIVGYSDELIEELSELTDWGDIVNLRLSGAWLDQCIQESVRCVLFPGGRSEGIFGRTFNITVDLSTCMASNETMTALTIEEIRELFIGILGKIANDARLTILS